MTGRLVIPFGELGLGDIDRVGGKSAHLADLLHAGFRVPAGFAVTTRAFELLTSGLDATAADVRELVEHAPVPGEVAAEIGAGYAALAREAGEERPAVAVRSSAVAEDSADASFAGVQDTYLWRRGVDEVLAAVRRCWASYFNTEALVYRSQHSGSAAGMSVAVQCMVDARVAGVMFTLNPVSGDRSSIAIDASYGLGTTVVGGEVTPDSFLVSKITGEILRSDVGEKAVECVVEGDATVVRPVEPDRQARLCLEPDEIAGLAALGRAVERHYGRPQDVEWAIDRRSGEVFLLQSRPETVWAGKAQEPEAVGSAVAAIAATFLGGADRKR